MQFYFSILLLAAFVALAKSNCNPHCPKDCLRVCAEKNGESEVFESLEAYIKANEALAKQCPKLWNLKPSCHKKCDDCTNQKKKYVCGKIDKTGETYLFDNICELKRASCKTNKKWKPTSYEECKKKHNPKKSY